MLGCFANLSKQSFQQFFAHSLLKQKKSKNKVCETISSFAFKQRGVQCVCILLKTFA
jgi:hypothetical protein